MSHIQKFVWDMTYACPLRCTHCYSESGRRPARSPSRADVLRIAEVIVASGAARVSMSGGEPLLVDGWDEAARRLRDARIHVSFFTSGWIMDDAIAGTLARTVDAACVSIDGATEATHDAIRGRAGSFQRALAAVDVLAREKRERAARGESCYALGLEYTVIRSSLGEMERFVDEVAARFPGIDTIRFGMAIPEGPAADEEFAGRELLDEAEMLAMLAREPDLAARARHGAKLSVTDMRYYVPYSPYGGPGRAIAHIEPDGQLRAFGVYEAKVGSVLDEPLDVLWERALAWRSDPFVVEQVSTISDAHGWARAARALDRRFGSPEDLVRIAKRSRPDRADGSTI